MSAAESEEVEASEEEAAEQADDDAEDQPDIEEEEQADLSALAEEVQEATDPVEPDAPDDDQGDDEDAASDAESDGESGESEAADGEGTAGDFYVDALVSVSNQIIQEHGREGASEISREFPEQLRLDEAVDELMAERGESSLPPEQHLLLGTLVFGALVAGTRTDLFDQLLENADLNL